MCTALNPICSGYIFIHYDILIDSIFTDYKVGRYYYEDKIVEI